MSFLRYLEYKIPMLTGEDVHRVQVRLLTLGYKRVGQADGKFGPNTDKAVRAFQRDKDLRVDGIIGPNTWEALLVRVKPPDIKRLDAVLPELTEFHGYRDSIQWRLKQNGVEVMESGFERTPGQPITVKRVWKQFGEAIDRCSEEFGVPAELIVATICTESGGKPTAVRLEDGYKSDETTPDRVSPGIMQTLISTARSTLEDPNIDRKWLLEPINSMRAGTAYIASQWKTTNFDPPKVACAYNAGNIYYNGSDKNRWKMKQFPIGSSDHADRFVKWFNDFYFLLKSEGIRLKVSFFEKLSRSL